MFVGLYANILSVVIDNDVLSRARCRRVNVVAEVDRSFDTTLLNGCSGLDTSPEEGLKYCGFFTYIHVYPHTNFALNIIHRYDVGKLLLKRIVSLVFLFMKYMKLGKFSLPSRSCIEFEGYWLRKIC